MKKLVTILFLSLVLVFSMVGFVGCNNNSGNTEEPPTQEHTHDKATATKGNTVDPTCTAKGYTVYTCTCGETFNDDEVNALGHDFKDYVYNNDATTEKNGTETAKCSRCDVTDTKEKPGTKIEATAVDSFEFVAVGDNLAVKAYKGTATEVTIPSTNEGKAIVAIADEAFKGNTSITKVTVTNSIKEIGKDAFAGCTALAGVVFQDAANWYGINGRLTLTDAAKNATALNVASEKLIYTTDLFYTYDVQALKVEDDGVGYVKLYTDNNIKDGEKLVYGDADVPKYTQGDSVIGVPTNRTMAGTKEVTYTSKNDTAYKATVTLNPITYNYYNTSDASTYKVAIANIGKAWFNDKNVAEVEGITLDETGITFARKLFKDSTGHNKLEIVSYNYTYILSVCAVSQSELDNAITFGIDSPEMSPFISALSGFGISIYTTKENLTTYVAGAKVVEVADVVSGYNNDKARKIIPVGATSETDEIENKYMLEVNADAALYISSYYMLARAEKLAQIGACGALDEDGEYLSIKGYCGTFGKYNYSTGGQWLSDGTKCTKPNGSDATVAFALWGNKDCDSTGFLNKAMYDKLVAAEADGYDGDVKNYAYIIMPYHSEMVRVSYVDDICGSINGRTAGSNFIGTFSGLDTRVVKGAGSITEANAIAVDKLQLV